MPAPSADSAISQLYREHHGWLLAFLRRKFSGDRDSAADIAQDTFERVLRSDVRPIQLSPRTHLTTIAKSLAIDQFRRKALEQAYLAALASRAEATAPSPEARALLLETLEQICAMLDGLPARAREIFVLSQFDGLAYAEIAARLDVSVNVVQKNMIKVLQRCYTVLYA
ncbi:sigma-70 family RNA polymerase sigma factor [Achromobacter marplatensis]|uniref:sigma-70 family RNA polymerase sigma factor n=1 Tax=Achromobacter marplatensis TaxID=470868 RepID=UPI0039F6AC30